MLSPILGRFLDATSSAVESTVGAVTGAANFFNPNVDDTTLGQSSNDYDFSYKVFPEDLTHDNVGHYMVININVPVKFNGTTPRSAFSGTQYGSTILPNQFSKVDVLRFGKLTPLPNAPEARQREALSIPRYTRRIKESIALFMPSSLVYSTQNRYEEISMTAIAGNVGKTGLNFATGIASAAAKTIGAARSRAASGRTLADGIGNVIGTASSIAGYPINPRVEVLYSTTPQREFIFEILMAPRSESESVAVEQIIQALRFHAAPEIDKTSLIGGFLFVPPAEFDITFFNKGVENIHIPRINTCVLERIEVDYAPTGVYSTFRNGHPVAARLSLGFREIEIIHKERILRGF